MGCKIIASGYPKPGESNNHVNYQINVEYADHIVKVSAESMELVSKETLSGSQFGVPRIGEKRPIIPAWTRMADEADVEDYLGLLARLEDLEGDRQI